MNTKELVCTVCPVGCRLTVQEKNGSLSVTGNRCPRGDGTPPASAPTPCGW